MFSVIVVYVFFILGKPSEAILRYKLLSAMKKDDRHNLDKVIKECIASGYPELDPDIKRARGALMGMEYAPLGGVLLSLCQIFCSQCTDILEREYLSIAEFSIIYRQCFHLLG